jgi:predicted dehydrogenase
MKAKKDKSLVGAHSNSSSRQTKSVPRRDSDTTVRIGIVGCGNVMDGAYMPLLKRLEQKGQARVVAASHTSRDRCAAVLDKWSIPEYFDSYEQLCRSPEIDLVLILTSMKQHGAIAAEGLRAGKHVVVEKPMAVTLAEAKRLLAIPRKASQHFVSAPFVTLSPTFGIIRDRILAGDVGKVCLARARYGWSGPDWADWFYRPGSGPIFDLAVYSLTSLTGILGPVKRVMAMTGTAQPTRLIKGKQIKVQVEDNAQILLDFGSSVFATVASGFTMQKYRSPALEFYGTDGTLQMLGDDWAPEGYEIWQNRVGAWQTYYETDPHWQWTEGLKHVIECIHEGVEPLITAEHSYHVLEIMLAALASGRTGRAQEVKSSFRLKSKGKSNTESEAAHRVHDRRRE